MPRGATPLVRSGKQGCRCELQMKNRSFSFSVKPFFSHPFFPRPVYLSFSPSPLSHIFAIVFSRADWMHRCEFQDASSWESAVALVAEWWARSHIWQPLAGKSPCPASSITPAPLYGADWIEIFRWLLRLLKQQNRRRTKTLWGGLSFISELSRGYTCSCSKAFQHQSATQHLSINQRLIKWSTS